MKEPYSVRKSHDAGDGSAGGIIPASKGYQHVVKLQQKWSVCK